jgi:hypothetical protein
MMPEKETLERAAEDKAEGKSPSTQAGEFVREEIEHVREGKHGARSTKQSDSDRTVKSSSRGREVATSKESLKEDSRASST